MHELERIVREADRLGDEGSLLATVVRVRGSSYRRPGARMLVSGDRWLSGCVSGGCLERDVLVRGRHRCRAGPVVVTYDATSDEGEPWGAGLGCDGVVEVLLEDARGSDAIAFARACFAEEAAGTLVTVIASSIAGAPIGSRLAIGPAIDLARAVSDPAARELLARAARGPAGVVEADGVAALVERIAPSPQLFVLGSAHDAVPLVELARAAGLRVTVADRAIRDPARFRAADRVVSTGGDLAELAGRLEAALEAHVVVMHHHAASDRASLATALASRARYVGILGPARRARALLAELGREDDPRVHAPVGLDVGAETPEQIALAIVAEIVAVSRGRSGGMLRARARPIHADVATIVLAAGGSTRLGRPKQLVEIEGAPLVRRVAEACVTAGGGPVAVVVGAHAGAVSRAVEALPIVTVQNGRWRDGVASSIRAGLAWAETTSAGALAIVLADQPRIPAAHLVALRDAWAGGAPIAATRWREGARAVLGAPAIFDRPRWPALTELEGDRGASALLRAPDVVAIDCPAAALDLDTPEDLAALVP